MSFRVFLLFLLLCFSQTIEAQLNKNFLLIEKKYQHPDGIFVWKYKYDDADRIKSLEYYQSNKLLYTEINFQWDSNDKITSYQRIYSNGKTPTENYSLSYYPDGKLWKRTLTKNHNGKDLTSGVVLKWYADKVEEYSGNPAKEEFYSYTEYDINTDGNIISSQNYMLINGRKQKSGEAVFFQNYDKHMNPELLSGNYSNELVMSKNNVTETLDKSNSFGQVKTTYMYNKNLLPISSTSTYKTDSYSFEHKMFYQYKSSTNAKATSSPYKSLEAIFQLASIKNANKITKATYKQTDVYCIKDSYYYIDGSFAFKIINQKKPEYNPPIEESQLKKALGTWIKDKNGNFLSLR